MSDTAITTILVALFACIPPSLLAWATLRSSKKNAVTAAETANKADVLIGKVEVVHDLTNSNLAAAMKRIDELETVIMRLVEERDYPAKPKKEAKR